MYFYVFDSFLQDKKYAAELIRIETRLAALGIQGRSEKITILKNIQEATRESIKRGATTIVAVGNDRTVVKLLPLAVEHEVTLGIIPVGEPQLIATYLGLPRGAAACDNVSRRVIEHLDLGLANRQHFLLESQLPPRARVVCEGTYTVESLDPTGSVVVTNLAPATWPGRPTDGRLELVIRPGAGGGQRSWFHRRAPVMSVFPVRRARVEHQSGDPPVILDGQVMLKTPITLEVAPKKLSVIVGKDRRF